MKIKSFDIIGSGKKFVAIVEIPEKFDGKEKEITEEIMKLNKNIKTVLKKTSKREGEYRIRSFELIAGDMDSEVVHKEYGYLLKVDPQKAYFSPREAAERQRIANEVKPNEVIMLMFAGICSFAVAIAKKQSKVKKIIAVDINPEAVKYMEENLRINKISHLVKPVLGDVKEICKNYFGKCDRVIMPLPLEAKNFLKEAISCTKKSGVVHYYTIAEKDNLREDLKLIEKTAKQLNRNVKILARQIVLPYSPHRWKYRIDFKVV